MVSIMAVVPLEAAVVRRIERLLDARGAWYVKTTGVYLVGCPDLLVCYKGYFVALEVKRSIDGAYQANKKQLHEIKKIRRAGGRAYVVYSASDVEDILDAIDTLRDC